MTEETPQPMQRVTLLMLRGISGSGKSTVARKIQKKIANTVVVSRDDIRLALYGVDFGPPVDEGFVTKVETLTISAALLGGISVISDNTNLVPMYVRDRFELARSHGAAIVLQETEVPLHLAKFNNAERGTKGGRFVPEQVIDRQNELFYGHQDEIWQLCDEFNVTH